jgi:hypothetical protein
MSQIACLSSAISSLMRLNSERVWSLVIGCLRLGVLLGPQQALLSLLQVHERHIAIAWHAPEVSDQPNVLSHQFERFLWLWEHGYCGVGINPLSGTRDS